MREGERGLEKWREGKSVIECIVWQKKKWKRKKWLITTKWEKNKCLLINCWEDWYSYYVVWKNKWVQWHIIKVHEITKQILRIIVVGLIELLKLNFPCGTYFIHSENCPIQIFGGFICWRRIDLSRCLCNATASFPRGPYVSVTDSSTEFPPSLLSISVLAKLWCN